MGTMSTMRARTGGDSQRSWIGADMVPGRFFEGPDVIMRIAPFVIAGVLPFALVPFADASFGSAEVLAAAALVPILVGSILLVPWARLPAWTQASVPLGYFAIVALLRDASPQDPGPFYPLVAIPVAWFALYGTRRELVVGIVGMGLTLALPALVVGEPRYDDEQYARAAVAVIIAIPLCLVIQSIVVALRRLSAESDAILGGIQEAFISMDQAGRVLDWNEQAQRTFGWSAEQAVGRPVAELILPERSRELHRRGIEAFLAGGEWRVLGKRTEVVCTHRSGEEFPVELLLSPQRTEDGWVFNGLAHDISDRKRSEAALMQAEERFRRAFEDSTVGMAITSTDGRFLRVNRALGDTIGYSVEELGGMRFAEVTHPDDVENDLEALREIGEGERYGYRTEKRYVHKRGHPVWVALNVGPVHDEQGNVIHMIAQMEDITQRKADEEKLTHQALHDPLTGLPNRILFGDRVRMASARREPGSFAVLYLDLDTFKPINDTLGHAAGDAVLIEVAHRLEMLLREGDTLARLGGDEFAILCEGVDHDHAGAIAARVIEAFEEPFEVDGHSFRQAASVGVAVQPRGARADAERVLRDADQAMYAAKASGRSRYSVFDGSMDAERSERSALERDLRSAVSKGELRVHYQPEVDLKTGEVTGAEALVRWQHPTLGLLEPARFMSIAEATGLVADIDDFVLWQACHQAARWRTGLGRDSEFAISVNVSARRLADAGLSHKIAQAISDTGLPASSLCLEVAERAILDRRGDALAAIPDIERLGVRLLIDDFGVAISSFSTIKRLPRLSAIKIDSSFIAGLGRSPEDSAAVAAIIGLAHGLRLIATAEGVETAEQAAELRELGCDRVQGFHFARPQLAAAFGELLTSARYGELLA